LIGGVFSIGLWGLRKMLPHIPSLAGKPLPRILREGEPVPYGVAIALGFLIMLKAGNIPVATF
jgi:Flp pilus assembly protein protease CpaA